MTDEYPDIDSFGCPDCGEVSDIHEHRAPHEGTIKDGFFIECEHCMSEFYTVFKPIDQQWSFEVGDWLKHSDEDGEYLISGRLFSYDNDERAYLIVHRSEVRGYDVMEYGPKDVVEEHYEKIE